MVREAYTNRPNALFPSADRSIRFGWQFFKANLLLITTADGLSAVAAFVISVVPLWLSHDPPWFVVVPAWFLSRMVIALGTAIVIRRGLDFWDELNELNRRRDYFDGLSAAFPAAARRLLPFVGYNLVIGVVAFAAIFPLRALFPIVESTWWRLLFGALIVGIGLLLGTRWVLVPIASVAGPGDAITTSWEMTKKRFWGVLGTFVQLTIMVLFSLVPLLVVRWVLGSSWIVLVLALVYAIGIQALYVGSAVNMYRCLDHPSGRSPQRGS